MYERRDPSRTLFFESEAGPVSREGRGLVSFGPFLRFHD
jgi:hypothetical protein